MKCKNCGSRVLYPDNCCYVCGNHIYWTKKDTIKEHVSRVIISCIVSIIVSFLTVVLIELLGK